MNNQEEINIKYAKCGQNEKNNNKGAFFRPTLIFQCN